MRKRVWIANFDGLIRYDISFTKNYRQNFQTLIRKVFTNEKLIFDGYKKSGQVKNDILTPVEYKNRNLRFEFASLFYEDELETQYRCFLEGYDRTWSAWKKEATSNYTNLDPGNYNFRVQARNVYRHDGSEDSFGFRIISPWFRTWWVYLLYGIFVFMSISLFIPWRARKLRYEKEKLEQIVLMRTNEIQKKNRLLEKQTIKLREQSEKLQEMDEIKSKFFANISHEFRTPLTLIMSPLQQMLSDSRDKKQKERYKGMLRNSQQLLKLINQLLDLTRFDSGKMKLQATCRDIVVFLKGIIGAFQVLAQQRSLNLEFYSTADEIPLYFSAHKMQEVMNNLLINAFKFTPPGGKNPRGTGIGLALVWEIIRMHHGKVDVHSQEGKGSEFIISLPLGHDHLKPEEIEDDTLFDPFQTAESNEPESLLLFTGNNAKTNIEGDEYTKKEEKKGKNNEEQKPVILLVEDNDDVRKYIGDSLERGFTVIEATDGKEGIEIAREIIPDLIVSDIMMPKKDGYELCRELKKDITTSYIPIILLTAKASEESIIQGLETGADDYITKPFNAKMLLTRIKNLIELRRPLQLKLQNQKIFLPSEVKISSVDESFFKILQDVIEKNLSSQCLNEDILCMELHLSQENLHKKIQALTSETPEQYILSYRLERAFQLLKNKPEDICKIAFEVGFNSTAQFAEAFQKKFHQLPTCFLPPVI